MLHIRTTSAYRSYFRIQTKYDLIKSETESCQTDSFVKAETDVIGETKHRRCIMGGTTAPYRYKLPQVIRVIEQRL